MIREALSWLPRTADDFGTLTALGALFALAYLLLAI